MKPRLFFPFVLLAALWHHPVSAADVAPAGTGPLRAAINDLIETFGERYPQGGEYFARLAKLEKAGDADGLAALQKEALLANPLLHGRPILFVVRSQYARNHGTEATMCQTGEINTQYFRGGGAIKSIDLARGGHVTTLLEVPHGVARDPDVHFDGRRIVFSMRRNVEDDYHLYEMNVEGGRLKQLTSAQQVSDIQPFYMPDGKITFSSTREPKYIPCQRHLMANLFTMNADGSNVRQLGHNTQFEGHASLMPDGRILYTRWEYVDKHYASAYGLWTMNPDGTNQAFYFGGYAWQPSAVIDARIIPGTQRFAAIYTTVHELPWGALVMGDRTLGLDGVRPMLKSWPADVTAYMRDWNKLERVGNRFDSFMQLRVRYEDPYPLSDKHFLCSRSSETGMGLFLVDVFGNEVLLHAERPGCFDPLPIGPRRRPPAVPARMDLAENEGVFYVQDVYRGDFMNRVKRGSVKYLRIVEAPAKRTYPPWNIGDWTPALNVDGHHPVAVNWGHYNNKRVLGKVPVAPDGSAYFKVPSGKFVYFQLLDENDMMIHSMRSGTTVQPGETVGCVGCHEHRLTAVPPSALKVPAALTRAPDAIEPWYGPPRDFSYTAEVQPVLDKHCVRCHDYGTEGGKAINLCGDLGPAFNVSYAALKSRSPAVWTPRKDGRPKALIEVVDAGPIRALGPYSWGSHASRLAELLRGKHYDVKLDRESFERIVTWIDLNTPYYPSHATYYRTHTFGRCPLSHQQLVRLGALVAATPDGAAYRWGRVNSYDVRELSRLIVTGGSPINFTRPEHSLCLHAFKDHSGAEYAEALGIIRAGKEMLAEHPRSDMPDFRPCEFDQARIDYIAARREVELRNRAAILGGRRVYDNDPLPHR